MSASLFHRFSTLIVVAHLLFSAVLLALVSNAKAQDITYDFANYPADEGTDTIISGTITTDGQ